MNSNVCGLDGSQYKLMIETIPHIVWMASADGGLEYLSPWGELYMGVSLDHIRSWGWLDLVHPDDQESARQVWTGALAAKSTYRNEFRMRMAGGAFRHCLVQGVPVTLDDGQVERWIGTLTDIQLLKQTQENHARDAESLLLRERAILAVTQGILITDPARPGNPIIFASPGFEKMTGYCPADILGRNCRFLQGSDTDPIAVAQLRAAIENRMPCTVELLNYRKDGSPFWNELSIAPVWDEKGRLSNFVGVQTDVSERRRLEEQYRQAQKMEAIGRLAGGIAHDFNNLLTVINGYSELALATLAPGHPLHHALEQILQAGERSASLTGQLLTFSRQQVLALEWLDLNQVLRNFEKILRRLIGEDIELTTRLAPGLGHIQANPGQIEQVLLNLAINARDAMPQGGRLALATEGVEIEDRSSHPELEPGSYLLLSFTDTGTGIAPEISKKIFEPFFTTKEQGKGTGLGLAVVHGIIRQAGGTIEVASEPGAGTTFRVYLPLAERGLLAETAPVRKPSLPSGNETILLVEDDDALRDLLQEILTGQGYRVLEAARSERALEIAAGAAPIHLLLTDVVLPGLGGRQVAEGVQRLHPETKVLYLSGYTDDALLRRGILQEVVSFLQKPFSVYALTQKVREALAR